MPTSLSLKSLRHRTVLLKNTFITLLLLLGAGVPASHAQQEAQVTTTFSAISLDNTISNLHYDIGTTSRTILIPNGSRSNPVRYSGPALLNFYVPEKGPEGETIKRTVASVNLNGFSDKQVLLVFTKNRDALEQYFVFPVDDSPAGFPANSWRVFNLTPKNMALRVGTEKPQAIAPGRGQLFSFRSRTSDTKVVQVAMHTEDGWHLALNSIWSHRPNSRSLIFLLPTQNEKSIRVQQFDQAANFQ